MTSVDLFNYQLPQELIAQEPTEPRDHCRLMIVQRDEQKILHDYFYNLPNYLKKNDLLVINNTKVIRARLRGKLPSGSKGELLLLKPIDSLTWEALVRPGRKLIPGTSLDVDGLQVEILSKTDFGGRIVRFDHFSWELLEEKGEVPLPPYIKKPLASPDDYQAIFAQIEGSVAAPTASLHFTEELMRRLKEKGVETTEITLHAGLGTFRPIKAQDIEEHKMHEEEFDISQRTVNKILKAKEQGGRVVAIGTTVVRALEGVAYSGGRLEAKSGSTDLYIKPGFQFRVCDALLTNFHLPKSTLLVLVSAFAGRELIMRAYEKALQERYRFFSFGDAMLIL